MNEKVHTFFCLIENCYKQFEALVDPNPLETRVKALLDYIKYYNYSQYEKVHIEMIYIQNHVNRLSDKNEMQCKKHLTAMAKQCIAMDSAQ